MSETSESSTFTNLSDAELRLELLRHGIPFGPIVQSTRKVYEKKLQNAISGNEQNIEKPMNGTMHGHGGGSTIRETTPLGDHEHGNGILWNAAPEKSPRPSPRPDEEGSDDDEEPSESARVLTPEEVQSFRSNFKSVNGTNVLRHRRQYSPLSDAKQVAKRSTAGTVQKKSMKRIGIRIIATALSCVFVASLFWLRDYIAPVVISSESDSV